MTNPIDVLATLLPLKWRGIEAPCQANDIDITQRVVEHKQYGVQASHVESTGRDSARFSFRVLFRAGLMGYDDLYPTRFSEFWQACLDSTPGKLEHPEFGELDAVVQSVKLHADPRARDGYDIDVVWLETNEGDITLEQSTLMGDAIAIAGDLEAVTDVEVPPYDDGTGLSLAEALKKIQGAILLAQLSVAEIGGMIASTVGALNDMIDVLAYSTDPKTGPILQSLKDIEAACSATAEALPGAAQTRRVVERLTAAASTVADLAAKHGMDLGEFVALNPTAAATGKVAAGALIFVFE